MPLDKVWGNRCVETHNNGFLSEKNGRFAVLFDLTAAEAVRTGYFGNLGEFFRIIVCLSTLGTRFQVKCPWSHLKTALACILDTASICIGQLESSGGWKWLKNIICAMLTPDGLNYLSKHNCRSITCLQAFLSCLGAKCSLACAIWS
jgi:hypothetical protein